jgi:dTDP-4-amino-4,6-dideoxygalactose transaminase
MRSALGLIQLEKLEQNNHYRREIDNLYRSEFITHTSLKSPFTHPRGCPVYHLSVILLNRPEYRSSFIEHLRQRGIQTSLHYPPIHLFTYYRQRLGTQAGLLPITEMASSRLVTLPLFASMLPEQAEMVIQAVISYNP